MKKQVPVFLFLLASSFLIVTPIFAQEEIRDNQFQLDNHRLEEKKDEDVSHSLELIRPLFSSRDRDLLESYQKNKEENFKEQGEQLFQQEWSVLDDALEKDLFSPTITRTFYTTRGNVRDIRTSSTNRSSGLTTILYWIVGLLIICGACFASYQISKGEE